MIFRIFKDKDVSKLHSRISKLENSYNIMLPITEYSELMDLECAYDVNVSKIKDIEIEHIFRCVLIKKIK